MSSLKLAIVIPAYKNMFFEQTLFSIANQTCKNFTLYIGDDASPLSFEPSIKKFENKIQIVYKRFEINLGKNNLVAQWERCIDMVKDEEWIWLFSDDDIMGENCVEKFFETVSEFPRFDVYHFNVHTINHNGEIISSFRFPKLLTSEDFFYGRVQLGYHSFVVEYIFRKSHFSEMGRFENFDLGWGSDDALWIKLGKRSGIKTINDATVCWRKSEYNISPNNTDKEILRRKFYARIGYFDWIYKQVQDDNLNIKEYKVKRILEERFLKDLKIHSTFLTFKMIKELFCAYSLSRKKTRFIKLRLINLYAYKINRFYIEIIKKIIFEKRKINLRR